MTQIINMWEDEILEDEISSYVQLEEYEKIIIHYLSGYYSGNGIAVGKKLNGEYSKWELGHCSCYGPFEGGYTGVFTKEEIIELINEWYDRYQKNSDEYTDTFNEENKNKLISLLD